MNNKYSITVIESESQIVEEELYPSEILKITNERVNKIINDKPVDLFLGTTHSDKKKIEDILTQNAKAGSNFEDMFHKIKVLLQAGSSS